MSLLGRDQIVKLLINKGASVYFKRNGLSSMNAGVLWGKKNNKRYFIEMN